MKFLNTIALSVFAVPSEEDSAAIRQALIDLVPLNLAQENITVQDEKVHGLNEQAIHIYTVTLTKTAHTNAFLEKLRELLAPEQKHTLVEQRESRLDNELNFFIRLDKDRWLVQREAVLTDSGRCFHIKLHLAAFPARRPDALLLVEKIFKGESSRV